MSSEMQIADLIEKSPCYPELRDRVALVTGGGTGIGRAIALRLAAEGMKVAICGRRREPIMKTAELISSRGGAALAYPGDVGDSDQVAQLFHAVEQQFGAVDAVVHNAMLMRMLQLEEVTPALWEEAFATACRGAYLLCRRAVPAMKQEGHGSIILISSVSGIRAHLPGLPYDSTKGALDAMTRALAIELGPFGIRANAVAPGATYTEEREPTADELRNPNVPLRRYGTSAEIAAAVAFLLSRQSSYITGQVLYVDGGITAQISLPGVWL